MGKQFRLKLEHAADFRRERFIVSSPNSEAAQTLDAWPDEGGGALGLIGPAGVGKTHLATAWMVRTGAKAMKIADLASERFDELNGPIILDQADDAAHDETFFHLLNWSARPGCALLLTGRSPPKSWSVAVPDLRSRLNAMPVIALGEPDDVILRGVLLKLFQERNIRPPTDLLTYLVLRMERSVPAAQAVVAALDEAASAEHRPISRALACQILNDETDDATGEN